MTAEMRTYGPPPGRVLAPVGGAFVEMPSDMQALADVIAAAMIADHPQFFKSQDFYEWSVSGSRANCYFV